jgi:hypothetical protein
MKISIYLSAIFVFIFPYKTITAGCDGVCISTDTLIKSRYYNSLDQDTIYINKGFSTNLYAVVISACHSIFTRVDSNGFYLNYVDLVWYKNGLPFDTTRQYTGNQNKYLHQLIVSDTGIYTVIPAGYDPLHFSWCSSVHVIFKKDKNANSSTTQNSFSNVVNANNFAGDGSINIFPNPFSDKIKITINPEYQSSKLILYNTLGMKIFEIATNEKKGIIELQLPREQISSGIYLYQLMDANNDVMKKGKIIAE